MAATYLRSLYTGFWLRSLGFNDRRLLTRFLVDSNGTEKQILLLPSIFPASNSTLHTYLRPRVEMCASLDQAVHYYVLRVSAGAFHISDPERGRIQNNEVLSHPGVHTEAPGTRPTRLYILVILRTSSLILNTSNYVLKLTSNMSLITRTLTWRDFIVLMKWRADSTERASMCRVGCHGHRSTSKEQQRRKRLNWESNQVRGTAIEHERNISTDAG